MKVWIVWALGVTGAIAFAAGLANVVTSGSAYPSHMTCVTDYDLIVCNIELWPAALWLVIGGGVVIAIALSILIGRSESGLRDHTR